MADTKLQNLRDWIASHGFAAFVIGDTVTLFTRCSLNGRETVGQWDVVRTWKEARDVLGY